VIEISEQFLVMESYTRDLQDRICGALERVDTAKFREDLWAWHGGGGGKTRVIQDGALMEKGGVSTSYVHGALPAELARHLHVEPMDFSVCGISLILHPQSPRVPTVHLNLRCFQMADGNSWFGGGVDLTPYYPHPEDFRRFHSVLMNACERAIPGSYSDYKKRCDEYFTIRHRHEMRGIGGIFFDHLSGSDGRHFRLAQSVGDAFLDAYLPMAERHRDDAYTEADKQFQLVRRGRYLEFNLLYDRGTLFGLKTNARIESVFVSFPPTMKFVYDWKPEAGTPQAEMCLYYQPREWVGLSESSQTA
jgi:coproporphyrinogen III oxidase